MVSGCGQDWMGDRSCVGSACARLFETAANRSERPILGGLDRLMRP